MTARITRNPEDAAVLLRQGQVVAVPTETVYGLAGNALDPQAVARIYAVKERPAFDPLIVHVAAPDRLPQIVSHIPELAQRLADRFWPGPLTLVLPKTSLVPDLVTSGLPNVAVRIPDHPQMQQLLRSLDFPLAAPSANLFGRLSPTTIAHVLGQLGDRLELVLDGGPCRVGLESTIVMFAQDHGVLLRPGGVSLESLEEVIGRVTIPTETTPAIPSAPGQLPSHYAPRAALRLVDSLPESAPGENIGLLLFVPQPVYNYRHIEVITSHGDMLEAAANFFPALHRLDQSGVQLIMAKRVPNHGPGRAINDRLIRASCALAENPGNVTFP